MKTYYFKVTRSWVNFMDVDCVYAIDADDIWVATRKVRDKIRQRSQEICRLRERPTSVITNKYTGLICIWDETRKQAIAAWHHLDVITEEEFRKGMLAGRII